LDESTDALRAEAVDIFVRRHAIEDFGFREVLGQRGLDQDAVDRRVGVELIQVGEQGLLGDRFREELQAGAHADLGGGLLLLGDVGNGSGVVTHAYEGDMGDERGEFVHAGLDFGEDLLGGGVTVDEAHGTYLGAVGGEGEKSYRPPLH
jgi:hypothetical protein